jgi:chitinase
MDARIYLWSLVLFLGCASPQSPVDSEVQPGIWVTAYYTYWGQYQHPPSTIDYSALTHIIHVSLEPSTSPPYYTKHPEFEVGWDGVAYQSDLISRTHAAGKKIILGLGSNATGFSYITSDETRMATYVDNVITYAKSKGYDGVDLDWEFPEGASGMQAHAALLKALRAKLDQWMPRGILTAAVYIKATSVAYDVAAISEYVDQANVMGYDMSGNWGDLPVHAGFNTALYAPQLPGYPWGNVDAGIQNWLAAGLPAAKMGLGLSFLAYKWDGVSEPNQTGVTQVSRTHYFDIVGMYYSPLRYRWNDTAKVPYLSNTNPDWFISYDDPQSLTIKVDYAKSKGLGGVMIWELWEGYIPSQPEGQRDPLLQAIKKAVQAK